MGLRTEVFPLELRSNYYHVCMENLEHQQLEYVVVNKGMTASVKRQKKKVSSLRNDNKLLQKASEELMSSYGSQQTVVGRNVGKLLKIISTSFIELRIFIKMTNPDRYLC